MLLSCCRLFLTFWTISDGLFFQSFYSWIRESKDLMNSDTVRYLKVVSATFLLVYFLSRKESTCETRENVFYLISEALFVLQKIKF